MRQIGPVPERIVENQGLDEGVDHEDGPEEGDGLLSIAQGVGEWWRAFRRGGRLAVLSHGFWRRCGVWGLDVGIHCKEIDGRHGRRERHTGEDVYGASQGHDAAAGSGGQRVDGKNYSVTTIRAHRLT